MTDLAWIVIGFIVVSAVTAVVVLTVALRQAREATGVDVGEVEHLKAQITSLQRSQAQVIHTTKMASMNSMVAGVAHEINTPLGFVTSNAEVVRDLVREFRDSFTKFDAVLMATLGERSDALSAARKELEPVLLTDAAELLEDSDEGLKQIAHIVSSLRSFSRVDRDGMDMFDLNEGIQSTLTICKHLFKKGIHVATELGELPPVKCMPAQINQVLLNLVTNAVQAMEGEGRLLIASARRGNRVDISVADNGPGIDAEVLPKIFDPFFTTKDVGEGTGLGLSISYKIVKGHGGRIVAKQRAGGGMQFIVSLPIVAPGQSAIKSA